MSDLEKAMRRNGVITAGFGVVFALAVLPPFHDVLRLFLQLAYWPMAEVPAELQVPVGVTVAISGGLTAGLGMVLWALGRHVAPIAPEAARRCTIIMGWSWFAVDSTASVLAGAPFNAVLNLIFLALIMQAAYARQPATQMPA